MSRHHHRFERDYRGPWERRDVRPTGLHNGGANHSCASAVVNGNNRPGLLPLPVIPSLLPTPVTVAVTTSSSDIAVKRGISTAGSVASASAKVRTPPNQRTSNISGKCFTFVFAFLFQLFHPYGSQLSISVPALSFPPSFHYLSHSAKISGPFNFLVWLSSWFSCQDSSTLSLSAASCHLPPSPLPAVLSSTAHSCQNHFPSISIFSLCQMAGVHLLCLCNKFFSFMVEMTFDIGFIGWWAQKQRNRFFNTTILMLDIGIVKADLNM